jgi:hypothetical protein
MNLKMGVISSSETSVTFNGLHGVISQKIARYMYANDSETAYN